jgi:hypothetical protein
MLVDDLETHFAEQFRQRWEYLGLADNVPKIR